MSDKPAPRPCSKCGEMLQPFVMGTSIDSNYNTVTNYGFGHNCPKQHKAYTDRIKEIDNSIGMNADQKANARYAAGYMNAWGA